ncbi:MAG: BrnT family toxin [Neisseriaceae bacterium]|nr:BrnT family toxin [Neisseriaceae bacterium]MBR3425423.1 BrnT family toxin [Neisseriaceae bacterium]
MQNENFEWDDDKADANYRKHGVSFDEAATVFDDAFVITQLDNRKDYNEIRKYTIGTSSHGRILVVVWTPRRNRYRLISAYIPEPNQRKGYEKQRYR